MIGTRGNLCFGEVFRGPYYKDVNAPGAGETITLVLAASSDTASSACTMAPSPDAGFDQDQSKSPGGSLKIPTSSKMITVHEELIVALTARP
jgi:hypothetical protein